jgi:C1A family cysteine protease
MPFPGDMPDGAHALCVVGYEVDATAPGGGVFIVRNSWGTSWAKPHGRFGRPGYGALYFDYLTKYGLQAFA